MVVILGWISSLDVIAAGRDPRSSLLERLTGDLSITLFDRAGTGLSPGPVQDYGLDASVAELADVVRAVGPPVSLLAMSAAGPIAVTLAHQHPEWIDSLVFFGTFASAPETFPDVTLREQVVDIARTHWGVGSRILADLYRPGISTEGEWHLAKVFRDSASPGVAADYLEDMYRQDVSAKLASIEAPALVVHYRSDRLIGFRGAQQLVDGLPHARLIPLDGRVHLPGRRRPRRHRERRRRAHQEARVTERLFVVQLHRATARHYDLRFEIDGMLASWAVPKGPTLDPDVRRLAIHVDDHELDHADVEGVLGRGDVIIWDRGTWEPYKSDDPASEVEAGELHAEVYGEKLRGRFVLIRTDLDASGREQWLLLHKHDEHAVDGWDPEDHPHSVVSGLTNDELSGP